MKKQFVSTALGSVASVFAISMLVAMAPKLGLESAGSAQAQPLSDTELPSGAAAEAERTYVGTVKCAACHFQQYKTWKESPHGKAFDILPAKYKNDADCLQCHTTGYGRTAGDGKDVDPNLAGISCEACHGPGSAHANIALRFVVEGITDEGERRLRAAIQRVAGDQCIKCHLSQAHKSHPSFDREKPSAGRQTRREEHRTSTFFALDEHGERSDP